MLLRVIAEAILRVLSKESTVFPKPAIDKKSLDIFISHKRDVLHSLKKSSVALNTRNILVIPCGYANSPFLGGKG
jgi:hypothetical protein